MSDFPSKGKALGMYKKMYEIRKYEESIYYLFLEGIMPGAINQSTGEEACAVGLAFKMQKKDNVVVCFFGDGASNEGSYHETMNVAGLQYGDVLFCMMDQLVNLSKCFALRGAPITR